MIRLTGLLAFCVISVAADFDPADFEPADIDPGFYRGPQSYITVEPLPKGPSIYDNPAEAKKFEQVENQRKKLDVSELKSFAELQQAAEQTIAADASFYRNEKLVATSRREYVKILWKTVSGAKRYTNYHHLEESGIYIVERSELVEDKDQIRSTYSAKKHWQKIGKEYKIVFAKFRKLKEEKLVTNYFPVFLNTNEDKPRREIVKGK